MLNKFGSRTRQWLSKLGYSTPWWLYWDALNSNLVWFLVLLHVLKFPASYDQTIVIQWMAFLFDTWHALLHIWNKWVFVFLKWIFDAIQSFGTKSRIRGALLNFHWFWLIFDKLRSCQPCIHQQLLFSVSRYSHGPQIFLCFYQQFFFAPEE
jgi:hypothetical protein